MTHMRQEIRFSVTGYLDFFWCVPVRVVQVPDWIVVVLFHLVLTDPVIFRID